MSNPVEKYHKLLISALVVVGVGLRFYYFAYPINKSSEITVDEAVYGIQAERIMNGARPVFYPAQDYTGSFSAYITAAIFSIFGVSTWGLKLVPFLFSVGTIWLIYLLALKIFNRGVAFFSLLISALGTPFWNNWSSRAGTGYVEATFIGILILLLTVNLAKYQSINRRFLIYSIVLGCLAGLGFWVQPTIIYFIIPSLVYLFLNLRKKFIILFALFCLGFVFGGFPAIYYNIFVRQAATTGALLKKPWGMRGAFFKLVLEGFPVLLGGRTSNSTKDFSPLISPFLYLFFTVSLFYFLKIISGLRNLKRPEFLVFLTLFSTIAIFSASTPFNQFSMEPRYVFSLYCVIPVILGLFLSRLYGYSEWLGGLATALYFLSFILGLTQAGPLSFLDAYSFKPLVEFLQNRNINFVVSTPSLGHRIMFFSGGHIKAGIRGGGITEVRFEDVNVEVNRALSLEPRLTAYAALNRESSLEAFRIGAKSQYLENYAENNIGGNFSVIYSK